MKQWLAKADEDLLAADAILATEMPFFDTAGFHAQQAAEKALKALLVRHQVNVRYTHEIRELLVAADQVAPGIRDRLRGAEELTGYAVDARYPGPQRPLRQEEAASYLEVARDVMAHVRELLQEYLSVEPPPGAG